MLDDVAVIMDDDDLLPEEFGEHGWRFAVAKKNLRRANASATERATAGGLDVEKAGSASLGRAIAEAVGIALVQISPARVQRKKI
ncbi:hypothetical protein MRX96_010787 [Rhipicephalus microplus]